VTGIGSTTWHIDWQLEESGTVTAQTSPADLTGQAAQPGLTNAIVGHNSAQTLTVDIDDWVMAAHPAAYPLGRHDIYALKVDPAGTPTVTGTVGNFALMTSNATGATLTAGTLTTARDNIAELPPTISTASSGVLQITTAATDYIEFPMNTLALTASQVVAGVKLLACLVSTTGAGAGTLGIRGYDGSVETVLLPTTVSSTPGSSTTVSGTVPPWVGYMWATPNRWTQTKLNAAALRFGFSNDATPDMGVHAMYLEVAVKSAETRPLFGDAATANVDPGSLAVASLAVTAPPSGDASLYYETNTVGTTVPVPAGTTATATPDAPDQATTNYIAVYWPPEGVPDA
jgi:hypothetical protein